MEPAQAHLWRKPALPVGIRLIPARLGALAGALVGDRPAIGWSLALLFLFKGLLCLTVAIFPISASEPTGLMFAAALLGIVASLGVWVAARHISLFGFELLAGAGSFLTSCLIAHVTTAGGVMIGALAYTWVSIYSAHFFPRAGIAVQGLLISAGFAGGMLANGLPHAPIYWVVVSATNWSICILLGNLSEILRRHAATDHLTGLLNRSGFLTAALRARAHADRTGKPLTVAVIDLDDFKHVNDCAGHAAGDSLLARIGNELRLRLRASDVLARHGGDEFVLLLNETSQADAARVLDRLCDRGDPISWSSGCSEWLAGETLDAPLARADARLYAVKAAKHLGAQTALLAS